MRVQATWGIDRVTDRDLVLDGSYPYDAAAAGTGVVAYVIDTGITVGHEEFQGRAMFGANFIDYPSDRKRETDCNGHGTHVAGTIGSATYGIAKDVTLIGVKVCFWGGACPREAIVKGLEWVINDFKKRRQPAVIKYVWIGTF